MKPCGTHLSAGPYRANATAIPSLLAIAHAHQIHVSAPALLIVATWPTCQGLLPLLRDARQRDARPYTKPPALSFQHGKLEPPPPIPLSRLWLKAASALFSPTSSRDPLAPL
jgi:hypothetical protein